MKFPLPLAAACLLAAAPALAGDIAAGEKAFRQCAACHVVVNPAGETLAGKSGKTGPNLYGVAGAPAGAVEGFRYSKLMQAANTAGLTWTEENFAAYIQDPSGYLTGATGESGRSAMTPQRLRKPEDAANLFAFLHSLQ